MILAENLSYSINDKSLIKDISLVLHPKKINLIIGPNGAGKSTLLKILTGQLQSNTGKVLYDDKSINSFSTNELAQKRALLSQSIELSFAFTVKEIVLMGRYPHFKHSPTKVDFEIVDYCMEMFGIQGFAERNFLSLSGGEKQRVQFARVIAQIISEDKESERLLALDEPLNALDIFYQLDFMDELRSIIKRENIVVVGVLHDLNLVAKYADQIIVLNQGELISIGSPSEVLTVDLIKKVYAVKMNVHVENERIHLLI